MLANHILPPFFSHFSNHSSAASFVDNSVLSLPFILYLQKKRKEKKLLIFLQVLFLSQVFGYCQCVCAWQLSRYCLLVSFCFFSFSFLGWGKGENKKCSSIILCRMLQHEGCCNGNQFKISRGASTPLTHLSLPPLPFGAPYPPHHYPYCSLGNLCQLLSPAAEKVHLAWPFVRQLLASQGLSEAVHGLLKALHLEILCQE